jgi:hypothetical protein
MPRVTNVRIDELGLSILRELPQLPPSTSPISLDLSLEVYLQCGSIRASKYTQLWPASASLTSLDYGLQVRTIMTARYISPYSLNHRLEVHPHICSITTSQCIAKRAPSRCRSASLSFLDYGVQVHHQSCLISPSECISWFT